MKRSEGHFRNVTKMVFDHKKAMAADWISIIGELEHIRRHAFDGAYNSQNDDDIVYFSRIAIQAKDLRREIMEKRFGEMANRHWCLCKSAASLRQLICETWEGDIEIFRKMNNLVDEIWEEATGEVFRNCAACAEDRKLRSNPLGDYNLNRRQDDNE